MTDSAAIGHRHGATTRAGTRKTGGRLCRTAMAICLLYALCAAGCVKLALRSSPSLVHSLTASVFAECDPQIAAAAIPTDLKLLEGLLREDRTNKSLLRALCQGFSGYALLFVEREDPQRAGKLFLRARDYGLQALEARERLLGPGAARADAVTAWLRALDRDEVELLFWTVFSWSGWLRHNLDSPVALAQIGTVERCLEQVIQEAPSLLHGAPFIVKGALLAAKPRMLGGDLKAAKACFEEALRRSERRFLLAQYYYARFFAVASQEKDLFGDLIKEIGDRPSEALPDVCLINAVVQTWAPALQERTDELFY